MGGTRADTNASDLFPLLRNVWRGLLALTLGLFAVSVPVRYEELRTIALAAERSGTESLGSFLSGAAAPDVYPLLVVGLEISFVVALFLVAY